MRTPTLEEQEAVAGYSFGVAWLVEMDLSPPLYANSSIFDLELGGKTYLGTRGLGKVDAVRESAGEFPQLKFAISGVPESHIALADDQNTANKGVRVKLGLFNATTFKVISTRTRFEGKLEPLVITDGPDTTSLEVTAESAAASLLRPLGSLFSDAEQQRLYPGDLFFQFTADQAEQRITWPSSAFGRQ